MSSERTGWIAADMLASAVDGMGGAVDTWLHVSIDVPGRLEPRLLQQALAALAGVIPELASHFQRRWWRSRWVAVEDPRWVVEEYHQVSPQRAEELQAELFGLPFDPQAGFPLRLRLFHLDDHDRLFLRVAHHLADGGGTKNLCYALAEAYRQVARDPQWCPAPRPRRAALVRLLACLPRVSLGWLLWAFVEEARANLFRRPLRIPLASGGGGRNRYAHLHLPASRVAALKARHRAAGFTLNDLALAAFMRAIERAFPEDAAQRHDATLIITADLRLREPQPGDDVGNFSGLRPMFVGALPNPEPMAHLQRVARRTRRWKRGGTALGTALLATAVFQFWPHALLRRVLAAILTGIGVISDGMVAFTNIGPIAAERLDFGAGPCLAAHVVSPTGHPPMVVVAFTGCCGALDFTVACRSVSLSSDSAHALLGALDMELAALE